MGAERSSRAARRMARGAPRSFRRWPPGLAALLSWPVLGLQLGAAELAGLLVIVSGLLWTVTAPKPVRPRDKGGPA